MPKFNPTTFCNFFCVKISPSALCQRNLAQLALAPHGAMYLKPNIPKGFSIRIASVVYSQSIHNIKWLTGFTSGFFIYKLLSYVIQLATELTEYHSLKWESY